MDDRDTSPRMERVIRFAEGDMDQAERAAFEKELEADPALKDDLSAAQSTIGGLRTLGEARLRDELRAADVELDGPRASGGRRTWWFAAAAVLVLLSGFAWWLMPRDTPQTLADQFTEKEEGLPVLMGTSPGVFDAIMNAYKQDDLSTAGQLLGLALLRDPLNDTLLYFNAVVLDRSKRFEQAEAAYAQVPSTSVFAQRALYRNAICALHGGNVEKARTSLQGASTGKDGQLAARSRELLDRLRRL